MKSWQRKNSFTGEKFKASMERHEVQILHSLVTNVVDLLEQRRDSAPRDELAELTGIRSGHQSAPDSAALARLLPDFFRPPPAQQPGQEALFETPDRKQDTCDYPAENSAMRMLHEPEILDTKIANAAVVLATIPARGGSVTLSPQQADAWLGCLNDLRLGLGAMLTEADPDDDIPDHVDPEDPRAAHLEVYHWLTFMQDSLCSAMMGT